MGAHGKCSQRMRGEEPSGSFEGKNLTGEESTLRSAGRTGNRTLQQVCEFSPYCARIWVDREARRADGRCASKKNSCKHTVGDNIHQRKNHKTN